MGLNVAGVLVRASSRRTGGERRGHALPHAGGVGGGAGADAVPAPGRGAARAARRQQRRARDARPARASRWWRRARTSPRWRPGRSRFYTAPIKALVSEKFFALCEAFGADDVGMLTGDAAVNADAPIIACTAEVLANIALREGARADVGLVVMDEFHYYGEPDRGWAWQVPLLELPQGPVPADVGHARRHVGDRGRPDRADRARDGRRRGRRAAGAARASAGRWTRSTRRSRSWSRPARRRRTSSTSRRRPPSSTRPRLLGGGLDKLGRPQQDAIVEKIGAFRFGAGFGKTLQKLVQGRHRRAPRGDAAEVPPARRDAGPGRPAQRHLRHRHPRRRHQRADPHGAVHRTGEVRRQPAAGAAHA